MIAVMPFGNLGPSEDEYFAAGITEEITNRLAGVNGLSVRARATVMAYDLQGNHPENEWVNVVFVGGYTKGAKLHGRLWAYNEWPVVQRAPARRLLTDSHWFSEGRRWVMGAGVGVLVVCMWIIGRPAALKPDLDSGAPS